MGDRTWMNITFPGCLEERFSNMFGFDFVDENEDGTKMGQACEVNYGGEDLRSELCSEGIPFFGTHGGGGCYGPCAFTCDGVTEDDINCDYDGDPMVPVNENGVTDLWLNAAKEYFELDKRAKEAVKNYKPPPPEEERPVDLPLTG